MKSPEKITPDARNPSWPFKSLRDYLAYLEERDRLLRITTKVDAKWEISAISRRLFQEGSDKACLFENVTSSFPGWHVEPPHNRLVEGIHRNMRMMEEALDMPKEKMFEEWEKRFANLKDPVDVGKGPCKENIITGEDVDLMKLPVEVNTGAQGGPFITMGVVNNKHPDTGVQNSSIYRLHVKSKNHTCVLLVPGQHIAAIYSKYGVMEQPMPTATAIGLDPLLPILSAPVPVDVQEMSVWGAITGKPLEVVKCETLDMTVPAYSEYILEGEMPQDIRDSEGPFGEYTGYHSGIRDLPIFKVKCITHRDDPIYESVNIGKPPCEANFLVEMGFGLELTRILRTYLPEVAGMRSVVSHGLISVIQVDKARRYKGLAQRVGNLVWALRPHPKIVFVIDTDIDLWDDYDMLWSMATRVQAHKSVQIVPDVSGMRLDPSEPFGREEGISCKMVIDCTEPFPPYHAPYMRGVALPPKDIREKVDTRWDKYFKKGI